ncbi:MAG TPA: hypothetical protein VGL89_01260 [Candidatus Koribacter sp.]|jgi:hypothetical protein
MTRLRSSRRRSPLSTQLLSFLTIVVLLLLAASALAQDPGAMAA